MEYLEKVGLHSGIRKFENLLLTKFNYLKIITLRPNIENIKIVNQTRGILND